MSLAHGAGERRTFPRLSTRSLSELDRTRMTLTESLMEKIQMKEDATGVRRASLDTNFVGRHLIVDASTFSKRNLTSTETIYSLFESLARNLDMTLVIPPIVCRFP